MTTTEIQAEIIAKQDELLNIYSDYVIGNEFEGFDWAKDFRNPANKCIAELAALKKQLKQVEAEVTEYELETLKLTPIPSGWICPRCQKVHNWMVQHCDCLPNVITASTTEPIKELAEIRGEEQTCNNCKYAKLSFEQYPCSECNWGQHDLKWEPRTITSTTYAYDNSPINEPDFFDGIKDVENNCNNCAFGICLTKDWPCNECNGSSKWEPIKTE